MEKSDTLQIKISPELKKAFFDYCRERSINPSEILRRKIAEITDKKDPQA